MYGLPNGIPERNLDIPEFILTLNPSFYARAYSGNLPQMGEIFKAAIENKGCSIVEVLQLCPSYNKEFTPQWATENIRGIEEVENYNISSLESAKSVLANNSPLYTGIIYRNKDLPTFYDSLESRKSSLSELIDEVKTHDIKKLLKYFE
jgi:2-oxoglutarate ferredoxin oxidoreductase subunit beta